MLAAEELPTSVLLTAARELRGIIDFFELAKYGTALLAIGVLAFATLVSDLDCPLLPCNRPITPHGA